ncbi:hypothetical protein BH24PSE2_BH24PSE2_17510 [soil metagenome]
MIELIYIDDAVRQARRSRRTVYRWIDEGLLPTPAKIRGRLAWRRKDFDRALAALCPDHAA